MGGEGLVPVLAASSHRQQDKHKAQYILLKTKRRKKEDRKLHIWQNASKQNNQELSIYRLRQMDVGDKVCEQVSMTLLQVVYPKEVIERYVQHSEP